MTYDTASPALQSPSFNALPVSLRQWLYTIDRFSLLSVENCRLNKELADRSQEIERKEQHLAANGRLITKATADQIEQITGQFPGTSHDAVTALHE